MQPLAQPCTRVDGSPSEHAYSTPYAAWYAVLATLLLSLLGVLAAVAERGRLAVVRGGGGGARRDATSSRDAGPAPQPELHDVSLPVLETQRLCRRQAALILLLEGLHELRDGLRSGDGDGYRGPGLLLRAHEPGCRIHRDGRMCTCVQAAVAELERLLVQMRRQAPRLRFHLVAWFVDADRRGRWEPRPRAKRRRPWQPFVYRRWVERNPRAERELALAGVVWLAERWRLRDARGELVEPWLLVPGLDNASFERLASAHSGLVRLNSG